VSRGKKREKRPGRDRAERVGREQREAGPEVIYGRQPVHEVLRAGRRECFRLLLAEGVRATHELDDILSAATRAGVRYEEVPRHEIIRVVGEGNHQGVALLCGPYPYVDFRDALKRLEGADHAPFVLVLDHLEDPQNVGSLLRSADAAGVDLVLLPNRRAAQVTPAAVRASAGASEHVHVACVANLPQSVARMKEQGIWFVGLEGVPEAVPYTEQDLTGALGIVVGSEGRGLQRLLRETCDFLVKLPLEGAVSSLNAAVAGAVALFEARRQRG
jgi:23S rRNA (guanosine2251-2'-O)-methyltransferase